MPNTNEFLAHHGILGQKWGVRRFQNEDGTRTAAGKRREQQNSKGEPVQYGSATFKRRGESSNSHTGYLKPTTSNGEPVQYHSAPFKKKVQTHSGILRPNDTKKTGEFGVQSTKKTGEFGVQSTKKTGETNGQTNRDIRNARIKRGAKIAAGVLATAAVGYALYKTGAGEKAINHGKTLISDALTKAGKTPANDSSFAINPKTGKKMAVPKTSDTNLTNSGASLNIPIKSSSSSTPKVSVPKTNAPKVTTAPKVSTPKSSGTNITDNGGSLNIPIRRSPSANRVVNSAASTPMSSATTTPARRKVAMRVVMDSADRTANINSSYDSINSNLMGFTNSMINQSRR